MKKYLLLVLVLLLLLVIKFYTDPYNTAYRNGVKYLDTINKLDNQAVMFDIDNTLLHFTFLPIKPIINLLNECKKRGFLIVIITARDSRYKKETEKDLLGIQYDYLYMRHDPVDNHVMFKSDVKQMLHEKNGITTVMSVGDNSMDIIGDHSGYKLKLPG
jgi:predicted HAD superfamily phosphohydrolase YqeG